MQNDTSLGISGNFVHAVSRHDGPSENGVLLTEVRKAVVDQFGRRIEKTMIV